MYINKHSFTIGKDTFAPYQFAEFLLRLLRKISLFSNTHDELFKFVSFALLSLSRFYARCTDFRNYYYKSRVVTPLEFLAESSLEKLRERERLPCAVHETL